MARSGTATKFRLQPADPFDLIRWLARTQSDPRKAVAELVQNSIDARATAIRIERRRIKGHPALVIRDDGEGVLPQLEREEALRYLVSYYSSNVKEDGPWARAIFGPTDIWQATIDLGKL